MTPTAQHRHDPLVQVRDHVAQAVDGSDPLIAALLANHLHADQVDRQGELYVRHLAAVAGILVRRWPDAPPHAVAAAWLHDAYEDTEASRVGLSYYGIPISVTRLVVQLTHKGRVYPFATPPIRTYAEYIAELAATGDLWAIRIKLADLEHNSDPARGPIPGRLAERYAAAKVMLEQAEAGRG